MNEVETQSQTCAASARKRTFAADTKGDGNAQLTAIPWGHKRR
jgi:hypothetical protein